ncbi:MAG: hypothetical protein QNJ46_11450 [Leptolyngbyaceae cyanobacterium MO_188.B28]|nr:hypothetical protein [Leptolyngbyaceae cyanobacterium MO_188.B28]
MNQQLELSNILNIERTLRRHSPLAPAELQWLANYYVNQMNECINPIGRKTLASKIRQLDELVQSRLALSPRQVYGWLNIK